MENSAYAPNSLPPPGLVVFSQASGLPDALRMQRPFNPQAQEVKDLHLPFSAAGFGLRHMDSYPGLPAHLLHHLQPQFLHPALDPRVPFGSGAFRPLGSIAPEIKGFPSAFAPPSKCLKIETSNGSHHDTSSLSSNHLTLYSPEERVYQMQQQRADSSSPASVSVSPPTLPPVVKEESSDVPISEDREGMDTPGSEGTERSTPEEGRGFRLGPIFGSGVGRCGGEALGLGLGLGLGFGPGGYRFAAVAPSLAKSRCLLFEQGKKKYPPNGPKCCPVCGVTLRPGELEPHFLQEMDRLYKISASNRVQRRLSADPSRHSMTPDGGPTTSSGQRREGIGSAGDGTPEGRYETYVRIKSNRQGRLRIKKCNKRKADETTCPVCNDRLQGSIEELNGHVESCLRKHGGAPEEEENVDVEGDDNMYEEYEWAGQRRIRTSSLLVGGYAATGMGNSSNRPSPADEDVELVVDVVDTAIYGPNQYTEADVVLTIAAGPEEEEDRAALREAVISSPYTGPEIMNNTGKDMKRPGFHVKQETSSNAKHDLSIKLESSESPVSSQQGHDNAGANQNNLMEPMDEGCSPQSTNHVLDALKKRIKELEGDSRASTDDCFKCLICMERYKKPVISVCCWHVHCEECWLHTLGAKKLCPQCNMITSPSDLRKIYM